MTGALDDEMRALAVELIDEFGKTVTIVRSSTIYDPNTGETIATDAETSVVATPPADYTLARIDGTLIEQGDTTIEVAAKGLDLGTPDQPTQADKVKMDSTVWRIVQVGSVYSGEKVATYVLHLRR